MAMTAAEYREKMIKETRSFHGIDAWHTAGYTGEGLRILEAERYNSDHGIGVARVMQIVAPDAEVFLGAIGMRTCGDEVTDVTVSLEDGTLEGQEAIDFLRSMDIIGASLGGSEHDGLANIVGDDTIIVCAAGNEGSQGVTGVYRNIGIAVGAIYLEDGEIKRERYSAYGDDELDFAVLHTDLEGTSFASPVFCGMCALIKSKYPNLGSENVYNVMRSISIDAGNEGFDTDFGWGVPVLPSDLTITLLEGGQQQTGGEKMENKPNKKIWHHSLTKDGQVKDFDSIRRYHMETLGWSDIGYHWIVEYVDGEVKMFRGRAESVAGAHTIGENATSIGICVVGNFDIEAPPAEVYTACRHLSADIDARWGRLPSYGHRDFSDKSCPGKYFDLSLVDYPADLSDWARDGYDFVVERGISDGTMPKGNLTREQLWTMLDRYDATLGW